MIGYQQTASSDDVCSPYSASLQKAQETEELQEKLKMLHEIQTATLVQKPVKTDQRIKLYKVIRQKLDAPPPPDLLGEQYGPLSGTSIIFFHSNDSVRVCRDDDC